MMMYAVVHVVGRRSDLDKRSAKVRLVFRVGL